MLVLLYDCLILFGFFSLIVSLSFDSFLFDWSSPYWFLLFGYFFLSNYYYVWLHFSLLIILFDCISLCWFFSLILILIAIPPIDYFAWLHFYLFNCFVQLLLSLSVCMVASPSRFFCLVWFGLVWLSSYVWMVSLAGWWWWFLLLSLLW